MNIAITMIDPTASNAATAATAATTTSASPSAVTGIPTDRANPSSNVDSFRGRHRTPTNSAAPKAAPTIRHNSGGRPASATGSTSDPHPVASSQIERLEAPVKRMLHVEVHARSCPTAPEAARRPRTSR